MRLVRSLSWSAGGLVLLAGSLAGPVVGAASAGRSTQDGCPLKHLGHPQAIQAPVVTPEPRASESSREDLSMVGPGRFVVCLDDGTVRTGDAGCWWSEDRTVVDSIGTSPFRLAGRERRADLWADVSGPALRIDGRGRVGYDSGDGGTLDVATPLGRTGIASFSDLPGSWRATGSLTGRFGWRCREAPPRRKGHTSGSLTFTLSAPLAGTFTTRAYCTWEDRPEGRSVGGVDGYSERVPLADGRYISMSLGLSPDAPEPSISVYVHVSDATMDISDDWIDEDAAFVLSRALDDAAGTARILSLHPDENSDEEARSLLDPSNVGGSVSWDCGEPPMRATGPYPWARRPAVPGSAMLTFQDAPIRVLAVAASCHAYRDDEDEDAPPSVSVSDLTAELTISGQRARLVANPGSLYVLMLLADDGSPLGECIAEPRGDDLIGSRMTDEGWQETALITFQPGPTRTPPTLFGAASPEPFRAVVTTDCPVPPEPAVT